MSHSPDQNLPESIAIVGMSGRFPGAANIQAFWENLIHRVESISRFSEEELEYSNARHESQTPGDRYVNARGVLEGVDMFDASFFGIYPKEAEVMDPQHRLFLECCWEALENAGYNSETYPGLIGVYAGASLNTYLLYNLCASREFAAQIAGAYQVGAYSIMLGNDKDFMPTRVSYKLDLKGPSMSVQSACSTSLVAISQACQSLLTYQCDMSLAGGVSITFPQKRDYRYQEAAMASVDGYCRPFDSKAQGTVFGHGVGVVLLKRLSDAIADGDEISAVIKGWAVNNDGAVKVGFAAPGVDGQSAVISMAHAMAGVEAKSISYIEAHGTGTPLGDPIEVAALTKAFRASTSAKEFCAIGTAKSNIGHLDIAAGVTGVIKAALSLKQNCLPPLLHFQEANPKIDFKNSPFYVNTELKEWKKGDAPRRAGVSSFGVGGTNAHVVMEEAPRTEPSGPSRPSSLLLLSAKTSDALDRATANLLNHLKSHPKLSLADAAYTLQVGRRAFSHRRALLCHDAQDAVDALEKNDSKRILTSIQEKQSASVVFMFPGQGVQSVNMAVELYRTERVFQQQVDLCADILEPLLGLDLRRVLYPEKGGEAEADLQLTQTHITQPALFVIEYAMARLWISWGIKPQAMIGHSVGEYVAACLAGIFTLEDALGLLTTRAQLMQRLPGGSMLAVRLSEKEVQPLLGKSLALAAVNGPSLCVVSGSNEEISVLERQLTAREASCRRLRTSHAFHSSMMDPVLLSFTERVAKVKLSPAQIPIVSTLTGKWAGDEMLQPSYWAQQLRHTVRFADAAQELLKEPGRIFLEVGPDQTLNSLIRQSSSGKSEPIVLSSFSRSQKHEEIKSMLDALGRLWLAGVSVDWAGYYSGERRLRVPLPTYPFERKRYWVEPVSSSSERQELPPSTKAASASGKGVVERIVKEQMRIMSRQLDLLRKQKAGRSRGDFSPLKKAGR